MTRLLNLTALLGFVLLLSGAIYAADKPPVPNAPTPTVAPDRQAIKNTRFHWYGLLDAQSANLIKTLKAVPADKRREVYVLCNATLDCLDLAQDIASALQDAGWKASVLPPMDAVDGLRCTVPWFCALLERATGIRSHVDPDEAPQIVLNFGHKGR